MKEITSFKELPPEKLAWRLSSAKIPFDTTEECESCEGIIGQDRAIKSIQTGLDVKSLGYNIFITGMVGTGRTTTIKQLLEKLEKEDKTPDDILFVNNFNQLTVALNISIMVKTELYREHQADGIIDSR